MVTRGQGGTHTTKGVATMSLKRYTLKPDASATAAVTLANWEEESEPSVR